jgi:diacylglycerol kinase family enzyme
MPDPQTLTAPEMPQRLSANDPATPLAVVDAEGAARICVIANAASGRNSHDAEAITRAMAVFGDRAELRYWSTDTDIAEEVDRALRDGFDTIVAAGGDGTVMAIASAMMGKDAAMAVLPLGTFNYFARGLGLPEDPEAAARLILQGGHHRIAVATVNGQVFLNNASLGVYPSILKERETTYARFGRHRIAAYWSVVKTFLRFQRPMKVVLTADGVETRLRSPLIFVARSAYQLDYFGLKGGDAISNDAFALFVARDRGRAGLFRLAWRLIRRQLRPGDGLELIRARDITISTRQKSPLIAFDGEKGRMRSPLTFKIETEALTIIAPENPIPEAEGTAPGGHSG